MDIVQFSLCSKNQMYNNSSRITSIVAMASLVTHFGVLEIFVVAKVSVSEMNFKGHSRFSVMAMTRFNR